MIVRPLLAVLAIGALSAAITVGLMGADAHTDPTHKILFNGRWHDPTVMNLSTSKISNPDSLQCENGDFPSCSSKWAAPIQAAVNDWNAQQDTADFVVQPDFSLTHDVIVFVVDDIAPGVLGYAAFYDIAQQPCDPNACGPTDTYYYGDVVIADDWHFGDYGTPQSKQATAAHELGHLLSLCHESVVGDCHSAEGQILQCGTDDSGAVPASVMSYDCIDPPGVGGSGMYLVQPFDVCGVNHAYPDAVFGFAGCPATPTPTPPPTPSPTPVPTGPNAWGNVDCGGGIGAVDALKVLRHAAGLTVSQTEPCPNIATELHVSGWTQGDVDCLGTVTSVDALKLLRFAAGLPVTQGLGCPLIGTEF